MPLIDNCFTCVFACVCVCVCMAVDVNFLEYSFIRTCHLQIEILLFFFSGCSCFFFLSVVLARASSTVFHINDKSTCFCLAPDLGGKALSLPSSIKWAVGFLKISFTKLRSPFLFLVCWVSLSRKSVGFSQMIIMHLFILSYFAFYSINLVYCINWFSYIEQLLHL